MVQFNVQDGFVSESAVQIAELQHEVTVLKESFDEAASALLRLRTEDEGWNVLGQTKTDDGFSLRVVKDVAKKSEIQSVGNPLLKAAFELRFSPIFGRGFEVSGDIKPRFQRKLDNESVQSVLFSADGYDALERTCFNAGNLFVAYNRISGDMMRIPLSEITERAVDPDLPARTAYYKWSRTRTDFDGVATPINEWLPVVEWWAAGKATLTEVNREPVNNDWTVVDMRVNVPSTGHWGLPDAFPALPYAWGYSQYIRNAASVLEALNLIAWKIVGKSKPQAQAAGITIAGHRRAGATVSMTEGTNVESMPRAGSVNMEDGKPIAGMVASATGISTNALLAAATGSGAAVQSLDGITVAMARTRQERWTSFYKRVFTAMGLEDLSINFPRITEDPIHRQVSSLATGRATGAMFADEYRDAFLEAMSIKPKRDGVPQVEEYAQAQNALGFMTMMENLAASAEGGPISRQGNSGVAGSLGEIDNTNRNSDSRAESGTQTDLVG